LGDDDVEGAESLEGIGGTALERLEGAADVEGKVIGLLNDLAGEDSEIGAGEEVGVLAVLEGVEVALWRAATARAEFAVAVCTTVDAAAHGPGATVGGLATGFVWVSWHGDSILAQVL